MAVETNVLSSLLGMYGSDSDSEGNSDEEEEVQKETKVDVDTKSTEKVKSSIIVDDSSARTKISESKPETPMETDELMPREGVIEKSPEAQPSDDEGPDEAAISKSTNIPDKPESKQSRKRTKSTSQEEPAKSTKEKASEPHSSEDEGPDEAAISKTTSIPDKPQSEPPQKKTKPNPPPKRRTLLDYRKLRLGRQNTMLEKLLEADIRHERNVLLQCVRFVVENNFFDKPKSS